MPPSPLCCKLQQAEGEASHLTCCLFTGANNIDNNSTAAQKGGSQHHVTENRKVTGHYAFKLSKLPDDST